MVDWMGLKAEGTRAAGRVVKLPRWSVRSTRLCGALVLALFSPRAHADGPSDYCGAFFDRVLEAVGAPAYLYRPLESLAQVPLCLNGESAICLNDDGTEPFELPDRYFLAVELPAGVDLGRLDSTWEVTGQRLAVCSESTWHPPAIRIRSYTGTAGLALANAAWDAESGEVPYKNTLIQSRGTGVFFQDVFLDLDGFPDPDDAEAVSLLRQHSQSSSGLDLFTTTGVDTLTVSGDSSSGAVLVRLVGETPSGEGCEASGQVILEGVSWSSLSASSVVYESQCRNASGTDLGGEFSSNDVSLVLRSSDLVGDGGSPRDQPLAAVGGRLDLEGVAVREMAFANASVFSTNDAMTVTAGSSLIGLTSSSGTEAALDATDGALKGSSVLMSDLEGWGSLVAGSSVGLGGAYICGSQAGALMATTTAPGGTLDLVSSTVLGSGFTTALGTGVPSSDQPGTVRLANVLFAGLSRDGGDTPAALAGNGANLIGTNLLGFESLAVAGVEEDGIREGTVRLWSAEASGQDCEAWGFTSGCEALSSAPVFTAEPSVLLQRDCTGVAAALEALVAAEGQAGSDPDLVDASLGSIPVLSTDQTDLVGAGQSWMFDDSLLDCDPTAGSSVDVGAYGGPCSLSFLAPVASEDPAVPNGRDSGAVDTASPGTDGGRDSSVFGLGSGCRYGGFAGVVLLPLAVALRRRR